MHGLKKIFCIIPMFALFSCANNATPSEPVDTKPYNVLFIGNSFTYYNSLDVLVEKIGKNIGINITTKSFTLGSHSLIEDTEDNDVLGKQIFADLAVNQYTDIVLQDKSNHPYNKYSEFKQGVIGMKEKIEPLQDNARLHLYETWGYNSDTFLGPIPEMEDTIRYNTRMVAKNQNMGVIYVGQAFTYVYENYKDINLYHQDNRHPSYIGSYLAALVHVATLTGKHVRNVTYQGEYGVTNEYGQVTFVNEVTKGILIDVAEQVVFGNK